MQGFIVSIYLHLAPQFAVRGRAARWRRERSNSASWFTTDIESGARTPSSASSMAKISARRSCGSARTAPRAPGGGRANRPVFEGLFAGWIDPAPGVLTFAQARTIHRALSAPWAHAGVAQLVRAPACHAGGRGFKSRHSRHFSLILSNRPVSAASCGIGACVEKASPQSRLRKCRRPRKILLIPPVGRWKRRLGRPGSGDASGRFSLSFAYGSSAAGGALSENFG